MATAKTCKQRVDIAKKHGDKVTDAEVALEKCLVKGGSCSAEKRSHEFYLENFMIFVSHVSKTCEGITEALSLVTDQALKAVTAKVKINPNKENIETLKVLKEMKRTGAKKKR